MEYIYDIVLNFQDEYYDFYEWLPSDRVINVKRIPIYKISTKNYLDIKNNVVKIDKNSLPKQNKMFLVTSGFEVMGVLIDSEGKVIKKSSLIFEEADDILDDKDDINLVNLQYDIINNKDFKCVSRMTKYKTNYVNNYLKNINYDRDEYLIKYLYYDIYQNECDDVDTIYHKLEELSKDNIYKLYDCIQRVNLELKR